ncbi:DEKNAAC105334 [Brettanomyces naardenensis]|uniref:DEKNAAC105334 n=1 Tax=Brettanomyces naardenensis TaxID=13370 RepID=A0A448YTC2_BRENA|nr:DEKNAAC105334 [Brettanomyces naardenensis]
MTSSTPLEVFSSLPLAKGESGSRSNRPKWSSFLFKLLGREDGYQEEERQGESRQDHDYYSYNSYTIDGENGTEESTPETTYLTKDDVYKHRQKDDGWMIIHNKVYDITQFLEMHPGGVECLIDCLGLDGTKNFDDVGHSESAWSILRPCYVGDLDKKDRKKIKRKKRCKVEKQEVGAASGVVEVVKEDEFKIRKKSTKEILVCISTNVFTFLGIFALVLFVYLQTRKWQMV